MSNLPKGKETIDVCMLYYKECLEEHIEVSTEASTIL